MSLFVRRLTGTRFIIPAVILVLLVTLAASAQGWLSLPFRVGAGLAPVMMEAQGGATKNKIEAELITITPRGFEPAEITRSKGRFLLAVDNRSGLDEVTLRLDRVAGNRLREVNVPRKELDWSEAFDLNPGQYVLSEANHPQWICRLTITAQ
jgi:hypothetical protein